MKLEVIAANVEDVKMIAKSDADRIEFCKDMEKGGLTPKYKIVKEAASVKDTKPIKVMVRPSDKTYQYRWWTFMKMWWQTKRFCKVENVYGLVMGILTKNNEVDVKHLSKLVKICRKHGKQVTFHRAIDLVPNYEKALKELHRLGVQTILTSGGTTPIDENIKTIEKLTDMDKVTVLAGGGVNLNNCVTIAKAANEIHVGSAIRKDHSWDQPIDLKIIHEFKTKISK